MTLDKFLSTPNACIICNTIEDFEFLQKIFVQKNIRWSNGHEFNNFSPNLSSSETYPVYITSNRMWGIVADTEMFSKMTTILDMEAIDDFYDERLTIEEFVNLHEKCAIHTPTENQALKLIDRLEMLGMTTGTGKPYHEYINSHNIQPYGDETYWSNKGTFGRCQPYYLQVYEFDEINFGITLTDFLDRPRRELRAIHCTTKEQAQLVYDAINKIKSGYMDGCPIRDDICYSNRGSYAPDETCYRDMKEPDGCYNACFAPIYEFEEVDLSK